MRMLPLAAASRVHAPEPRQPRKAHHPEGAKLSTRVVASSKVTLYTFTLTIEGGDISRHSGAAAAAGAGIMGYLATRGRKDS